MTIISSSSSDQSKLSTWKPEFSLTSAVTRSSREILWQSMEMAYLEYLMVKRSPADKSACLPAEKWQHAWILLPAKSTPASGSVISLVICSEFDAPNFHEISYDNMNYRIHHWVQFGHTEALISTLFPQFSQEIIAKSARDPCKREGVLRKKKNFSLGKWTRSLKACSQIVRQSRIALQPNVSDKLTPLQINATHSLRRRADLESISLYPSVVDTSKNYDVIQIQRNCGKDNKCVPDLRVQSKAWVHFLGNQKKVMADNGQKTSL